MRAPRGCSINTLCVDDGIEIPEDRNLLIDSGGFWLLPFAIFMLRMGRIRYTRVRTNEGAQPIEGDIRD